MNTNEIKYERFIFSFDDLYKEAKKQFLAYEKIEGIEDWNAYDFSIDCAEDQMKLKDMLEIRFVEELTEASEAWELEEKDHFWEELTDALNFFLSAYVMIGVDFKTLTDPNKYLLPISGESRIPETSTEICCLFYTLIHYVGKVCNLLKNRPWSQSNYLVSLMDFDKRIKDLWDQFWRFFGLIGLSEKDVFIMFEKKMMVNFWRMKTGY